MARVIQNKGLLGAANDLAVNASNHVYLNGIDQKVPFNISSNGTQKLLNNTFDTDLTGWNNTTGNWSVINGKATIVNAAVQSDLTQGYTSTAWYQPYKVVIEVTSITGTLKIYHSGQILTADITVAGTYTFPVYASYVTSDTFFIRATVGCSAEINAVYFTEYTEVIGDILKYSPTTKTFSNLDIGTQLISNPDFTTDITGWTLGHDKGGTSAIWDAGRISITDTVAINGSYSIPFTTKIGAWYKATATSLAQGWVIIASSPTDWGIGRFDVIRNEVNTRTRYFKATAATSYIHVLTSVLSQAAIFDNITVEAVFPFDETVDEKNSVSNFCELNQTSTVSDLTYLNANPDAIADLAVGTKAHPSLSFTGANIVSWYPCNEGSSNTFKAPYCSDQISLNAGINEFLYSEDFDNVYWGKTGLLMSYNTMETTDPLGGNTADIYIADTGANYHNLGTVLSMGVDYNIGDIYTASIFLKPRELTSFNIYFASGDFGYANTTYDLLALTASNSQGTIEKIGAGWYRISLTAVCTTKVHGWVGIRFTHNLSYIAGDGISGMYVWGAQLERGVKPSVYQHTTTTKINDKLVSWAGLKNYTTACRTTLENTNYGLSRAYLKEDATGRVTGVTAEGTIEFHGDGNSLNTNWIPTESDFTIESVAYMPQDSKRLFGSANVYFALENNGWVFAYMGTQVEINFNNSISVPHHIALVYVSSTKTFYLYVDGTSTGSEVTSLNMSALTSPFTLGKKEGQTSAYLNAPLGSFKKYSTAKSATQIAEAYAKAKLVYPTIP